MKNKKIKSEIYEKIEKKLEILKNQPETIEQSLDFENFFKIMSMKSEYSEEIAAIEEMIEKALKKKTMLLVSFHEYKYFLYKHFLEIEKVKKD